MEREMAKSADIRAPHFQKDVIIPQIYNLENIKLIQSCNYPESPLNKVALLKKKNIQNVIKAIVYKPNLTPQHTRKPVRVASAKKSELDDQPYKQILASQSEQGLLMDLDEQLGELISLMEQNLGPATDRIQAVLAKVSCHLSSKNDEQKQLQVQKYLSVCPKMPLKTNPEVEPPVKGMLQQLQDLRKSGIRTPLRRRVQSAKVEGSRKTKQFMQRQGRSRLVERCSTENLKVKKALSDQITKSRQLITMINECLGEEGRGKKKYVKKLGEMRGEWAEQGKLQRTLLRSTDMPLNAETLSILRERRLKQQGISRIDRQHLS